MPHQLIIYHDGNFILTPIIRLYDYRIISLSDCVTLEIDKAREDS